MFVAIILLASSSSSSSDFLCRAGPLVGVVALLWHESAEKLAGLAG
jgi:hypothetical protein